MTLSEASDKDTIVNYIVTGDATAGTDYVALLGSVTVLAGNKSATIDVTVIDESLLEDNETVIVTLSSTSDADVTIDGSAKTATVTIADDDVASVSIAANLPSAGEPATDGQFRVTLSESSDKDTVISYLLTGTADEGDDYSTLTGSVTILAGETTATIDVAVIDDDVLEQSETVIMTLTGTDDTNIGVDSGANTATVNDR